MKPKSIKTELDAIRARSPLLARPGFLIRRLHQIHTALFLEETRDHQITPVQYSLLTALAEEGEMDQNTVALSIGLERTSVAEVLPRLEARELLQRRVSEADRRVKLVRLMPKGYDLLESMRVSVQRAHDRTIELLSEPEREMLLVMMARLVEANEGHSVAPMRLR
ncbi:MAG TPA: MarR family transcriptional regulator [Bordetella sp.]|jgi:DNA-binding MarR family transcriptional regulator|nr:MarR family transcriptional regulator [Bordetella sp.]